MIKVFIFDLGGVLENHKLDNFALFMAKKYKIDKNKFYSILIKNLRRNDKLEITDEEFITTINKKFCLKLKLNEFYGFYFNFISSNKFLLQFVKSLKKSYTLAIFSNTRKMHIKEMDRRYHYSKIFDKIFISQEFRTRKPEMKYYRFILKELKVQAEECLFIDDKERNLRPARKIGFHCIKFTGNLKIFKEELKKLNLKF